MEYNHPDLVDKWTEFYDDEHKSERKYKMEIQKEYDLHDGIKAHDASILIEWSDLNYFDNIWADHIIENPTEELKAAEQAALNQVSSISIERWSYLVRLHIRIIHMPDSCIKGIQQINADDVGIMYKFKGTVSSCENIQTKILRAGFECARCHAVIFVDQTDPQFLIEPFDCSQDQGGCGKRAQQTTFKEVAEQNMIKSFQSFVLEEEFNPELPAQGNCPCEASYDLVGLHVQDEVTINGIVRTFRKRINGRPTTSSTIYIEVHSIEREAAIDIKTTDDELEWLFALQKRSDHLYHIRRSICPKILGLENEKVALLLALFGASPFSFNNGVKAYQERRASFHLLFLGPASCGKSELIRWGISVAPIGGYANCASGAERTALLYGIYANPIDGTMTTSPGVIIRADMGTAFVDELDKLKLEFQQTLLQPMEDQFVTLGKGPNRGARYHARTTVIACANPSSGDFIVDDDVLRQFKIYKPLESRFLYLIVISPNFDWKIEEPKVDRSLSNEMGLNPTLKESTKLPDLDKGEIIPSWLFKKWIHYARKNLNPTHDHCIKDVLKEEYRKIWEAGAKESRTSIFLRQANDLVRVCEASARMHLRNKVTIEDAKLVIEITNDFWSRLYPKMNGETIFDPNYVEVGKRFKQREMMNIILKYFNDNQGAYPYGIPNEVIVTALESETVSADSIRSMLATLVKDHYLWEMSAGSYRLSGKI